MTSLLLPTSNVWNLKRTTAPLERNSSNFQYPKRILDPVELPLFQTNHSIIMVNEAQRNKVEYSLHGRCWCHIFPAYKSYVHLHQSFPSKLEEGTVECLICHTATLSD